MPEIQFPRELSDVIGELQRRVAALERSPSLTNSSIAGGTLKVNDSSGRNVATIGDVVNGDGVVVSGFTVTLQPQNAQVFWIDAANGQALPLNARPLLPFVFTVVTSATFVNVANGLTGAVPGDSCTIDVQVYSDAGTTGEIRVRHNDPGGVNTPTATQTINSSGVVVSPEWRWRHGIPLGNNALVTIEARRASGAGNVYIGPCTSGMLFMTHPVNAATITGV